MSYLVNGKITELTVGLWIHIHLCTHRNWFPN